MLIAGECEMADQNGAIPNMRSRLITIGKCKNCNFENAYKTNGFLIILLALLKNSVIKQIS